MRYIVLKINIKLCIKRGKEEEEKKKEKIPPTILILWSVFQKPNRQPMELGIMVYSVRHVILAHVDNLILAYKRN